MNKDNELISRGDLKEAISDIELSLTNKRTILDIIDNAPTVAYPFYQEAYQTGYEEGKNEILKGKCENCDLYFKAMTKEEKKKGGAE